MKSRFNFMKPGENSSKSDSYCIRWNMMLNFKRLKSLPGKQLKLMFFCFALCIRFASRNISGQILLLWQKHVVTADKIILTHLPVWKSKEKRAPLEKLKVVVTLDHKTSLKYQFFEMYIYTAYESWINKLSVMYGLLGSNNIWSRYNYLNIWNLRVQKKIFFLRKSLLK